MTFRDRAVRSLSGAVLAFGMTFANMLLLCGSAGLPFEWRTLLLIAAAFALAAAAVLLTPRPLLALAVPFVVTGGAFALFREEAAEEVYRFAVCLAQSPVLGPLFKNALGFAPSAQDMNYAAGGPAFFWIPLFAAYVWGSFLILFLSGVRGSLWYTAFDTLFFAALAVFMGEMPSVRVTVLFAGLHAAYLLASLLLERSRGSASAAALGLLLPCLLFAAGIRYAAEYYERPAFTDAIVEKSVSLWRDLTARKTTRAAASESGGTPAAAETAESVRYVPIGAFPWNRYADRIDLDEVGPRRPMDTPVMEIYSDRARTVYLRGVSYAVYESDRWTQLSPAASAAVSARIGENTASLFTTDVDPTEQLRIRMATPTDLLWLPYTPTELPAGAVGVMDSYVVSNTRADYTVLYYPNAAFAPVSWEYYNHVHALLTEVPDSTAAALAGIVSRFDAEDPNLVFQVADYVRNCAVYDTGADPMPAGEDFVPWFLTSADRGYCVHFASAAAVLLRCLGIPARYVTGYMVQTPGSGWTEVTEDEAHAWVEYFDESLVSWRILETTPSVESADAAEEEEESDLPAAPLPNLREEPEREDPVEESPSTPAVPQPVRRQRISLLWLIPAALLLAVVLWPLVRSARRKAAMDRADPALRAVLRWRLIAALTAAVGWEKTDAWKAGEEIALKARFSPHGVTEEEEAALDALLESAKNAVRRDKRIPRRLRLRWFYGI